MTKPIRYTRFIKKSVREELTRTSRYRCCLRHCQSRILIPGVHTGDAVSCILHFHHLIYYSNGGPPTAENLALVCPNCHALIHLNPKHYSIESIMDEKKSWVDMVNVVPHVLDLSDKFDDTTILQVPLVLESRNLSFELLVPSSMTIFKLTGLLIEKVISPIGSYENNFHWFHPDRVEIALRSSPKSPLNLDLAIADLFIPSGDTLIPIIHLPTMAMPGRRLHLFATPANPSAGQRYVVTTRVESGGNVKVKMRINGTDGYIKDESGTVDAKGEFHLKVPGASQGIVDIIEADVGGDSLKIEIIFRSRHDRLNEGY